MASERTGPRKGSKQSKPQERDQRAQFIEAAREVGANENEAAFDKALKKVASAPPPKSVKKKTAKRAK